MRFSGRCYRGHDPAWSFAPLSGQGAAMVGGRFNCRGQAALYLSLDVMTSIAECTQGLLNRLQPLTMCEYDVDCEDIADLRDDAGLTALACNRDDLGVCLADVPTGRNGSSVLGRQPTGCRRQAEAVFSSRVSPPEQRAAISFYGIGGHDLPHRVDIYDPNGRLPQDRSSWPSADRT